MWLCGSTPLDHMTINRFRSEWVRPVFESAFAQVVEFLVDKGLITLQTYYQDGTKIEANANKYAFVWKKSTEGYREKLQEEVRQRPEDIAEAARRINERLKTRPKGKELKRARKAFESDYLPRMERYESQLGIFEGRKPSPRPMWMPPSCG